MATFDSEIDSHNLKYLVQDAAVEYNDMTDLWICSYCGNARSDPSELTHWEGCPVLVVKTALDRTPTVNVFRQEQE